MQILPGDFLQNIWKNTFKIYANGMRVKVKHERVQLDEGSVVRSNRLFGSGWDNLVDNLEIVVGQMLVFTNLGNYKLNMALFFTNGRCMHEEIILPTMLRLAARGIPPYAIKGINSFKFILCNTIFKIQIHAFEIIRRYSLTIIAYKRAKHICSWKGHNSHNNENDVFYAELNGPTCEFYHVVSI